MFSKGNVQAYFRFSSQVVTYIPSFFFSDVLRMISKNNLSSIFLLLRNFGDAVKPLSNVTEYLFQIGHSVQDGMLGKQELACSTSSSLCF